MKSYTWFWPILAGACMLCSIRGHSASEASEPAQPAAPSALPGLPSATAIPTPIPFDSGTPTAIPGSLDQFSTDPNAPAGVPGAIPTPPPLTALGSTLPADATTTGTTETITASTGPIETYEFLFREDEEKGVLREKYLFDDAQTLRRQEIERLIAKNQTGGQPAPAQQGGADPRAGAEWDFYYEQLEMYSRYVKEKLLPGVTDLTDPAYDAQNALQERTDLKTQYEEAALQAVSDQFNENREFYERLETREDRRLDFYEWLAAQQTELDEWTGLWARKVNGSRWADGEPVRRDDWYYGVDFNSASPVTIEIDQREYLLSRQPLNKVPQNQVNVISRGLTPYDVIDATGSLKNPDMERLRGTLVVPPLEAQTPQRTLEIVP